MGPDGMGGPAWADPAATVRAVPECGWRPRWTGRRARRWWPRRIWGRTGRRWSGGPEAVVPAAMGGGPEMGGRGGGRGGPDWQGRPNAMAFGNGRRDPRTDCTTATASFSLDNSVWDARSFSVTGAAVNKPSYANGARKRHVRRPAADSQAGERQQAHHVHLRLSGAAQSHGRDFGSGQHADRAGAHRRFLAEHGAGRGGDHLRSADRLCHFPATGFRRTGSAPHRPRCCSIFRIPICRSPTRNYQTSWSGRNNSAEHQFPNLEYQDRHARTRSTAAWAIRAAAAVTPNLFQFIDTGAGRGINANVAWSRTITARVINNLRYNFSRSRQLSSPYFADRRECGGGAGHRRALRKNAANWGPPNLSFTNYGGLTDGNYSLNRNQTSAVGDSLTWVRGVHNFYFRRRLPAPADQPAGG